MHIWTRIIMASTVWINIIQETTIMSKQPFHSGKDKLDIFECASQVNNLSSISSCFSMAVFFPSGTCGFDVSPARKGHCSGRFSKKVLKCNHKKIQVARRIWFKPTKAAKSKCKSIMIDICPLTYARYYLLHMQEVIKAI